MRHTPRHVSRKGHSTLTKVLRPKRIAMGVAFVFLGLVIAFTAIFGISAVRMYWEANRFISAGENLANAALGCGSKKSLSDSADELVDSSRKLNDELNKPQWTWVRDHTAYGNDIVAARTMLQSVNNLVEGPFTDMVNLSKDLSGFSMKDKTVDLSALSSMPKIVHQARTDIQRESKTLKALKKPKIHQVASAVDAGANGLEAVDKMLDSYDELVNLFPELLGENGERTYLLTVQNPAELRSAGGMVGNYAVVTANKGVVDIGDFKTTLGFKNPTKAFDDAGEEEARLYGMQVWNWPQTTTVNPDYQRAAVNFKNLWQYQDAKNKKREVAGVITVDPVFLQAMVGATGNVTLEDGTVLNGTNTVKFFERDLYVDHPNFSEQNEYTSKAAKLVMNHILKNAKPSNLSALLKALKDTTSSSHLKIWMQQQSEFDALVQTGLINENAAGELPGDATTPVSGVYLNETQPSKLDWYMQSEVKVTRSCDGTVAAMKDRISDKVSFAPRSTVVDDVDESQLGDEYTVEFTMKNTLTKKQVSQLPSFVVGTTDPGTMSYRMFFMAPTNGEITSIAYNKGDFVANMVLNKRHFVAVKIPVEPESSVTVAYTVRVPKTAKSALNVVNTPLLNETGIQTGSNGAVVDNCAASSSNGQQSQAPSQSASATPSQSSSASPKSSDSASKSSTSKSSPTTSSGSSDDPLSSLKDMKSRFSCPVDIKSMMG
ncbi:DUF4012 domain-containing protein [Bifidobacterium sp. 82T24]|uniref:DUF4012 domain-containing protein n=1 Tax=Bifidobacterium pluvialisilvae TaxID=2834436 RepID=UPI001C56A964|nr:DUF4012 domain-containing protein [Bifidobacterium pluvialisilvae]MBW3087432.1 DUF4012 domain-containing protein [Bifidobacterium pluvialisilvae]